ncbi:MAG TPA: SRPBCC domain-containing protein [Ferruginibacter sp.]|nr:SRPBCC domain-containing protein [Ferruginibacter sp.]
MQKTIKHQFFFPNSPEVVWEYLTKSELMKQWLMPNDFQLILGYDFQFTTKPIPSLQLDGIFHCKVVEIVPLKKLSYSWKGGPAEGDITLDSLVVWTLIEKNNGTELQLVHSGFKEIENFDIYTGMTNGWMQNIQKIANLLNTQHGTTNA